MRLAVDIQTIGIVYRKPRVDICRSIWYCGPVGTLSCVSEWSL